MRPGLSFPIRAATPLIAAHRGSLREAPENTMAAFERAVRAGTDMIELDVHPTRDGQLVVMHDVTTTRTTGRAHRLQDLTAGQLRSLDAGSWFDPAFASQSIPTLDDVLAWAKDRVYLNLDVRNYPSLDFYRHRGTAAALIAAIERARMVDQVVVQCLDHELAREVHERLPAVAVGITQHGRPVDPVAIARAAGAILISGDAAFATPAFVTQLHAAGIGLMTGVEMRLPGLPDDPAITQQTTRRLLAAHVDVLVTDDLNAITALVAPRRPSPAVLDTTRNAMKESSCPPPATKG